MTPIVLATANARFAHTSLALRFLKANLDDLEQRATILEFTLEDRPADIAEKILDHQPVIVGLSVYLWNVGLLGQVVHTIKQVRSDVCIVLGGPEVSYPEDFPEITATADYIIAGEGDLAFAQLCKNFLAGRPPAKKIIHAPVPDLDAVRLPYSLYTDADIAHRVIYAAASRGCPNRCEFCLSSRDAKVRRFPEDQILAALDDLWQRGARRFKFIDRTLQLGVTPALLRFFLERQASGLFVHFELVPGPLPEQHLALLKDFQPGVLQLEVGVQTLNPDVAHRIGRNYPVDTVIRTLSRLRNETSAHLHTDLVAGLPGETMASFADGFDRLIAIIHPHEIQVGILKRLRGAPIARHDVPWQMRYSESPPYEILQNSEISFAEMQRLKRFARYFDLIYNSGNFISSAPAIWQDGSAFWSFMGFSDWLFRATNQTSRIALPRLAGLLFKYLSEIKGLQGETAADLIKGDFERLGRKSLPQDIGAYTIKPRSNGTPHRPMVLPPRQRRRMPDVQ
ncbi:MAG: DUF4080 domain-containing protein [Myxococcota bacterium]|nr:DUF4080 domain-containing protein [Myxococcota bacterium]